MSKTSQRKRSLYRLGYGDGLSGLPRRYHGSDPLIDRYLLGHFHGRSERTRRFELERPARRWYSKLLAWLAARLSR